MRRLPVAMLALGLAAAPAVTRAQTITVGPGGQLSSLVGVPFDMPLVFDLSARSDKLGAFAARIAWDPAVLRFEAGFSGNFGTITANTDSAALGVVRLTSANPAGAGLRVTVGSLRFTPIAAATTTIAVTVSEAFAAGTFADLMPSLVVSDGTFCPARGRYGDIDQDGAANSRDALIALSNAVGLDVSAFDITLGDVDASGATNARDALIVLSSAVGLDVSAFLVYRMALGACTVAAPVTLVINPAVTGDLVPGEEVRFELRAADATGALQTVSDAYWSSSNPAAVGVLSTGRAFARDTGTAVIKATRDGRDTVRVTVRVVLRRTTHYVSAGAISAENRLGTDLLPFASLAEAAEHVGAGDTVVVRPGRYTEGASFRDRVVIIGETVGGIGAVVASSGDAIGLELNGLGRSEIHNLAIEGFQVGVFALAVDTLVVDSLRLLVRGPQGCFATGIQTSEIWALIVRRSSLVGDGQWSGCADGIAVYGNAKLVALEDVSISDFGYDALYAPSVDSVVVRRARLHDNGDNGLDVGGYGYDGGRVPAPTSLALVVEDSRLERNYYEGVYAYDLRSGLVARSVIDMLDYDDGLSLSGTSSGASYVKLVGDSIRLTSSYYDWIDAYDLDSVVIDSVRVRGGYDGYFSGVDLVRVTNSTIVTSDYYGTAIYMYSYDGPSRLVVDSVHIAGSPSCSQCADGIYTYGTRVTVNRLVAENLDYAVHVSDSSLSVTNSTFDNVYYGVYAYSYATPRPRLEVRQVTATRAYYGIQSYNMVTVVDSATLTGTAGEYEGIYTYGGGADTVRSSTVTGYDYGIDLEDSVGYAANNTMLRPQYDAFYFSGNGTAGDSAILVNNTVTCDAAGAENAGLVDAYRSNMRFEGNTSTGCNWGIYIESGLAGLGVKVRGNTISIPAVADYSGIWVGGPYRSEIVGNVVTGGAPYADGNIYLRGYSYAHAPFARVDSNTVQQAQVWGIRVLYVDSLGVRGNLVEDVATPCCFTNPGGIALYGGTLYQARIAGNTLRRAHGAAISINQFDTATVFVDSNAISAADTAAVRVSQGSVTMRGNNIRNNAMDGVRIVGPYGTHQIHGNAFKSNALYAVNNDGSATVDITGNWWGVDGVAPGVSGADSVRFAGTDTLPLAAEPTGLPPLAPPAQVVAEGLRVAAPAPAVSVEGRQRPSPAARSAALLAPRPERPAKPARVRPRAAGSAALMAAPAAPQSRAVREAVRAQLRQAAQAQGLQEQTARDGAEAERRARRAAQRRSEP